MVVFISEIIAPGKDRQYQKDQSGNAEKYAYPVGNVTIDDITRLDQC